MITDDTDNSDPPSAASPDASPTVTFKIDGKPVASAPDSVLLNAILNAGLLVETACGGKGTCHLCRVTIEAGAEHLPPPNAIERHALGNVLLAQNIRLSCQLPVHSSLQVRLPVIETPAQRRARIRLAREKKGKP